MSTSFVNTICKDRIYSIANKALKLTSKQDIESILDDLVKIEVVDKLDFSGNTIGIEASRELADFIEKHESVRNNIKEINFADLYTSRLVGEVVESLELLLPVLLKCPRLELLNLSDNAFGLRTIDILENYISNAITLKHLILSNNGMGPFAGERIGKALFVLAERKKKYKKPLLESFICGRNRLENGSAKFLALGLKNHGESLKTIRLYQNGIRPNGIITLLKYGLKFNTKLEVLDLQDNTFTKTASCVLADILPQWKNTLKELNLNDCLLKGLGSDIIVTVLFENKFIKMETLKLQYNEMAQTSLEDKLLPALQNNNLEALKFLELNGNRFEEDSDALDKLQVVFNGQLDELDDLEEVDSDDLDGEDEEKDTTEDESEECSDKTNLDLLERQLYAAEIEDLTKDLELTHI